MGATELQVLLVDDHELFREGMKYLLRGLHEGLTLHESESCEAAVERVSTDHYDLILLDLKFPGLGGLGALSAVREACPNTPVVVLSGEDAPALVRQAIEQGAMGFIPKSSTYEILIQALKLVLAGGVYLPRSVLTAPSQQPTPTAESGCGAAEMLGLSERQLQVLRCVIEGKPNKVIARDLTLSEHTVKAHLSAVLRVLGARNRTEAVYEAAKLGVPLF